jgi:subtilisin
VRIAAICAVSALVLASIPNHALAQEPPSQPRPTVSQVQQARSTFIFKFDESVERGEMHARAQQAVAGAGASLRHVYTNVLGGFSATIPGGAVWRIAGVRGIVAYKRDEIVSIAAPPWCKPGDPHPCNDDGGGDDGGGDVGGSDTVPWGVGRIGGQVTGAAIHVYVLDTGIDFNHGDLNVDTGKSWDCTAGCAAGRGHDDHGHGTHVAGTIGAMENGVDVVGVAPDVTLHSLKVLDSTGYGYESDIIAALNIVAGEAATNGAVVANLSLGGSGKKSGTCSASGASASADPYNVAFCDAARAGVVIAVAAGNSGADAESFVPAAYDDAVITASATDSSDKFPRWSNWGNDSATWAPTNSAPVAISAPGVSILSTQLGGGTTTKSGTSMASPHVAGVAAILLQEKFANDANYAGTYQTFLDIRGDMLDLAAESFDAKGKNPHDEKFLCSTANC